MNLPSSFHSSHFSTDSDAAKVQQKFAFDAWAAQAEELFAPQVPIEAGEFAQPSTAVAPDLLGCTLVRKMADGRLFRGLIVETEAYAPGDPACHAYRRRTARNAVMFGPAGVTYVYLIYGIYHCLNIVTDLEDCPSAVLIRALQLDRLPESEGDRPASFQPHRVAAGPGKLCRALQINQSHNGQVLAPGRSLWVERRSPEFQQGLSQKAIHLVQTTRIGLSQGAEIPWRWYIGGCSAVSKR